MPPRRLVSPTGRAQTLAPVRPSAALQAAYEGRLLAEIDAMNRSILWFVRAAWRANTPHAVAQDASPAADLLETMRGLGRRWTDRFAVLADDLGRHFATAVRDRSDAALKASLRKGGFTVAFRPTRAMNDVFQATLAEQVNLIKSIASEHLTDVQGIVMRSVQTGRDLGTLAQELETRYGTTKRRAAFIAQSQNNIATATMIRTRQAELGITQAVWLHSAGGRVPRPEHVAASGKTYDVAKGMFLEGKWTWPGVEPRCRCVSKSVITGF
jgi:uncharacterized protein with gpF-like domain